MTTVQDETKELDLESLVREHQADLWRYVRFLGAAASEADDLVQETFLAIVRRPFEQRSARSTAAYLRTAARRQLLMVRRRQKRELNRAQLEAADNVWAKFMDHRDPPLVAALEECLQQVNGRAQRALELFYRDGQSREAIAEQLNMKPDGVKTLLRRSRDTLRDCIQRKAHRD